MVWDQETFFSGKQIFAPPSSCTTYRYSTFSKAYNGRWAEMPTVQQPSQPEISANDGHFKMFILIISGSAFSTVWICKEKGPQDGSGYTQQAWAALREKFYEWSREALGAEHHKMSHTKMIPGQDPDEFHNLVDSCRLKAPRIGSMRNYHCKPCNRSSNVLGGWFILNGGLCPIFLHAFPWFFQSVPEGSCILGVRNFGGWGSHHRHGCWKGID